MEVTNSRIRAVQLALKANGFNPGKIDGVFGCDMRKAVVAFQKKKGLPIGSLTLETLNDMGIDS